MQERVDQVVRVIRGAGEQVRPVTPAPDGSGARALRDAATFSENADRA